MFLSENSSFYTLFKDIILPLILSMIPVVILYLTTQSQINALRKSLPLELKKIQKEKTLEKMVSAITFYTRAVLETETLMGEETFKDDMNQALIDVVIFGDKYSVEYASHMMQRVYSKQERESKYSDLIMYAMFVSYLKYDLTGEWVSPELILKVKINDYSEQVDEIEKIKTDLINDFQLKLDENGPVW